MEAVGRSEILRRREQYEMRGGPRIKPPKSQALTDGEENESVVEKRVA